MDGHYLALEVGVVEAAKMYSALKDFHQRNKLYKGITMTNEMTLFDQPTQYPTYLKDNPVAKALAEQTEGGLDGGISINRISLRGMRFRFNVKGVEVAVNPNPHLDVVIVAANPYVSRLYYSKPYDDDAPGTRPDCYSIDGRVPEEDSPMVQSAACATCPQNVKGSAVSGGGKYKACSYAKRAIVVAHDDIPGIAFAVDFKSQSLFGDDDPAQKKYNLKSYIEALKTNGLIVPAVVTRLSFDDQSSVAKLFMKPVRPLTAEEWQQVEARLNDPVIRSMLADVDNKTEEGKPVGQPKAVAAPTPTPPAQPAGFPSGNGGTAPARARGRPAKSEAAPAQAPAPQTASKGFGVDKPTAPPPVQTQATIPAQPAKAGFSVDLDNFDA